VEKASRDRKTMNEKRQMLRHFLAALAYRTQKALRGAPDSFANFSAGAKTRTPHELIVHMRSVLGYARTFFIGGVYPHPVPVDWRQDIEDFHAMLEDLARYLESAAPLQNTTEEQMLQGPFSDAMTHAGQIAMLRRLAGMPVASENFIIADIRSDNLSSTQPDPVAPDKDWPKPEHKI
jgi:hypothetical protein